MQLLSDNRNVGKNFRAKVLDFDEEFFPFCLWCCWSEEMLSSETVPLLS